MLKKKKVLITLAMMVAVFVVASALLVVNLSSWVGKPVYWPFHFILPAFMIASALVIMVVLAIAIVSKFLPTVSWKRKIFVGLMIPLVSLAGMGLSVIVVLLGYSYEGFSPTLIMILTFVVIALIVFITIKADFKYINNRLQKINLKMQNCSTAERERLIRQKQMVESELQKFWSCEYCKAKNHSTSLRCHGCGANRK